MLRTGPLRNVLHIASLEYQTNQTFAEFFGGKVRKMKSMSEGIELTNVPDEITFKTFG